MILLPYLLAASGLCCWVGFLCLRPVGSTLDYSVFIAVQLFSAVLALHCRASHSGFSLWGVQALGAQAQWLWGGDLVALQHVGSSWTRDWAPAPCIGRQVLNHWITRKAPIEVLMSFSFPFIFCFFIFLPFTLLLMNLTAFHLFFCMYRFHILRCLFQVVCLSFLLNCLLFFFGRSF